MKHIFTIILTSVILSLSTFAQTPELISYQAVLRTSNNVIISNKIVGMQIQIKQSMFDNSSVYSEIHYPLTTESGLISVQIGGGISSDNFSMIDWSKGPYFIKVEIDPEGETNYTISSISQLLSVPYAFHATTAERLTGDIQEADPLFVTSNAALITDIDISNLSNLSGINTGDQDISHLATIEALKDSIELLRSMIPDVSNVALKSDIPVLVSELQNDAGFITSENDADPMNEIQNLSQVLTVSNNANDQSIVNVSKIGVGTATPNASAALEINSKTGALLLPRMTTSERDNLSPQSGMIIFNTTTNTFQGFTIAGGNCQSIENNDDSKINSSTSVGTDNMGTPNYVGQSFIAPNCTNSILQSISVKATHATTAPVTCTVYQGEGYNGTVLGNINFEFTNDGKYTIDMSSLQIILTPGNTYSFRLYSPSNFSNSSSIFHSMGNDPFFGFGDTYTSGNYLDYLGNPQQNTDLWFEISFGGVSSWVDLH